MKSLSQRPFRYTFCLSVSVGRRFRSSCFPGKPSKLSLWDQLFTDRFSASHLSHFSLWFPSMFADLGPCYQTTLGTSNPGTAAGLTECPPHHHCCSDIASPAATEHAGLWSPAAPVLTPQWCLVGTAESWFCRQLRNSFPRWVRIIFIKFIQSYPTSVSSSLSWACHIQ